MRRLLACFVGTVGTGCVVAAFSVAVQATDALYETDFVSHITDATFRMEQRLTLPLSRLRSSSENARLFLRHTVTEHRTSDWGAIVSVVRPAMSIRLFLHERHEASPDPFRLVHGSVRTDTSKGAAVTWRGRMPGYAQYVNAVPLRDGSGPLLFARVVAPAGIPVRLSVLTYGTERLRHHFTVVDGDLAHDAARLRWGIAWQGGVALDDWIRRTIVERAMFVRLETAFGRHRAWMSVHDTSGDFRSLAASSYPFQRGITGIESRWQWRPATNHLVSVYGEKNVAHDASSTEGLEISYSSMPRRRWGWRIGWNASRTWSQVVSSGWEVVSTNPDRRFNMSMAASVDAGGYRHRARVEWNDDRWRMRLAFDDGLPGWRAEWRWTDGDPWQATIVYKQRTYAERGVAAWLHARLSRDVPGFGEVWVQWMEPDLGRLDVGWSRPDTIAAGIRVTF